MPSTAKNTVYLLAANIYQKIFSLIYLFLLARFLGVENFGKYSFAFSFAVLFSIFLDLGAGPVLTREIARDERKVKEYLNNLFGLKFILSFFVFGLIFLLINLSNYPDLTKIYVYSAALIMILDSFSFTFYQVFRGLLNLKYEALGVIFTRTISFAVGLTFIILKLSPVLIILPILFGSIFYFLNAFFFLKRKLGFFPSIQLQKPVLKLLLGIAFPFFIAGIFSQIFGAIDTVLLSYLKGDAAVGLYASAQKILVAVGALVGGSLSGALYPAFSFYFTRDKQQLHSLFNKTIFYSALVFMPAVFGVWLLGEKIIFFVYGQEFILAAGTLRIISLSLPLMLFDYLILSFLNACEKQKVNTLNRGLACLTLVVFNLILIPHFSHLGSAIACLMGFLVLSFLGFYQSLTIVKLEGKYLQKKFLGILFASLLMSLLIIFLKEKIHVLLLVGSGVLVYLFCLYLLKVVGQEEIRMLKDALKTTKLKSLN